MTLSDRLVPATQILSGTSEKVCKHQNGITAIRPKAVEETYQRIVSSCVREQIVYFDAIDRSRLPVLRLSGKRHQCETSRGFLLFDYLLRGLRVHRCR